ncbi:competence/damage-inducible protein A [Tissierella sp. Yu-01]|uniref:competence/damage-inducible protein A n=1 Tax=Tissierella sp. Yu-01 TaxID=3035694 RepID=UPI00240E1403|nr:competence/damage-inducible protein A [Tissierella sp. Yu-01]WFA09747.1 competence/damage-inducible protein A [Tissierella sp. Yu-01]
MRAEIITVGTEIMVGSIVNTNSKYLSSKLIELGIEPCYHTSVDDNEERLTEVINIALQRADLILTTGGLGPTQDDMTKEVIAKALDLELEKDIEIENEIAEKFNRMHRNMTNNNKKQALKPKNSEFIKNENGTAPGIYIDSNSKKIIMLPGPPKELIPMFEKYVLPILKQDTNIIIKSINTIGIGESALEVELKSLDIYEDNFDIATFAKDGTVEIKIIAKGSEIKTIEEKLNYKMQMIEEKIGSHIYGYNNIPIEEILINLLREKQMKVSLCESCTGGLISSKITKIPGASLVFDRGLITYSNNAKINELNVSPYTLEKYGAVSEQTAYEMAKGLLEKTKSDIVLSITGIAGPDGGSKEKPVGLVYFCVMTSNRYKIIKEVFSGNRAAIQNRAALKALFEIKEFL